MGALGLIIPNTLFDWAYLEQYSAGERMVTGVTVDNALVFVDVHLQWQTHAC